MRWRRKRPTPNDPPAVSAPTLVGLAKGETSLHEFDTPDGRRVYLHEYHLVRALLDAGAATLELVFLPAAGAWSSTTDLCRVEVLASGVEVYQWEGRLDPDDNVSDLQVLEACVLLSTTGLTVGFTAAQTGVSVSDLER